MKRQYPGVYVSIFLGIGIDWKKHTGVDVDGKYVIGRSANELQVYRDLGYVQNADEVPITWDQKGNPRKLDPGGMAMPTREGMHPYCGFER